MKNFIFNALLVAVCIGALALFLVISDRNHEKSSLAVSPTNSAVISPVTLLGKKGKDFCNVIAEIEDLKKEIEKLKGDLAEQKDALPKALEVIGKNKDKNGETKVTLPNGNVYSLFKIRRSMCAGMENIEILQTNIANKEAKIAELQNKKEELWVVPSDDELLKKGRKILEPAVVPPPPPAK